MARDTQDTGQPLPEILYLVSDSTGGILTALARSCLERMDQKTVEMCEYPLVRTPAGLDRLLAAVAARPGMVLHDIKDAALAQALESACRRAGVPVQAALSPLIERLSKKEPALGQRAPSLGVLSLSSRHPVKL